MNTINYCVSGIWKVRDLITHVLVHEVTDVGLTQGVKLSVERLTAVIQSGMIVSTIYWDYERSAFYKGNILSAKKVGNTHCIITSPNGHPHYNLERLPDMNLIRDDYYHPLIKRRK